MHPEFPPIVAIVDDDSYLRESLQDLLEAVGVGSRLYCSAEHFLTSGDIAIVHCVLADVKMPGISGLELLDAIVSKGGPPVCIMTSYADTRTRSAAARGGAVAFLDKPINSQALIGFIKQCIS